MSSPSVMLMPVHGIGEVQVGTALPELIHAALLANGLTLQDGDVLVVTQKIVSKAEGQTINLAEVQPSPFAYEIAAQGRKHASYYEVVLRESRRIVRMQRGVLITETHHGFICANAGVDNSNVPGLEVVTLLPRNPDLSAATLRHGLHTLSGAQVAIVISDSFGRPWREGQVNVAIGVAGLDPLVDYTGQTDPHGYRLEASMLAVGDELASAAELVMNKIDRVPAALVRGYRYRATDDPQQATARRLLRDPQYDLFR